MKEVDIIKSEIEYVKELLKEIPNECIIEKNSFKYRIKVLEEKIKELESK